MTLAGAMDAAPFCLRFFRSQILPGGAGGRQPPAAAARNAPE